MLCVGGEAGKQILLITQLVVSIRCKKQEVRRFHVCILEKKKYFIVFPSFFFLYYFGKRFRRGLNFQ